jgi:hypothetical protein
VRPGADGPVADSHPWRSCRVWGHCNRRAVATCPRQNLLGDTQLSPDALESAATRFDPLTPEHSSSDFADGSSDVPARARDRLVTLPGHFAAPVRIEAAEPIGEGLLTLRVRTAADGLEETTISGAAGGSPPGRPELHGVDIAWSVGVGEGLSFLLGWESIGPCPDPGADLLRVAGRPRARYEGMPAPLRHSRPDLAVPVAGRWHDRCSGRQSSAQDSFPPVTASARPATAELGHCKP